MNDVTEELLKCKETLAYTIENNEVAYETLKLHDEEEIGMLNSKVAELEQQIEAMKCCENCKHYSASCFCNLPFDDCFELSAWELRK